MASIHAELGEAGALDDMLARLRYHSQAAFGKQGEAVEGFPAFVADFEDLMFNARAGRPQANGAAAAALIQRGEALLKKTGANGLVQSMVSYGLTAAHDTAARLAIAGADFKSAEAHAREALALTTHESDWDNDAVQKNVIQAEHALALARLKRYPEAVLVANQALAQQRAQLVGSDDQMLRFEMAQTLYALALAKPGAGRAEMQQAAALLANLPAAMQRYRSVKMWRARVAAEL
jgi:hypothetical protein